jgi:hypothetical protein
VGGFGLEGNNTLTLVGDILQPETRTIMVMLYVGKIDFVMKEVDMLKGEHMWPAHVS